MPPSAQIPLSEPPYLMGLPSAYYKETHFKWQKTCRAFVEEAMLPYAAEWEKNGDVPGTACIDLYLYEYILTLSRGSLRQICSCQFSHTKSVGSITSETAQEAGDT
jgi:hypothetical protein